MDMNAARIAVSLVDPVAGVQQTRAANATGFRKLIDLLRQRLIPCDQVRKVSTSLANSPWCWNKNPCAASG
jgi:hypothetical protein